MSKDYSLSSYYNFDLVVAAAEGVDKETFSRLVEPFDDFYEDDDGYPYLPMFEHGLVESTLNTHTSCHDQHFHQDLLWEHHPEVRDVSTGKPIRLPKAFTEPVPTYTFYFSGLFNKAAPDFRKNPDINPMAARDELKARISELGIRVKQTGQIVHSGRRRPPYVQHMSALVIAPR